eukprot:4801187-Pyramimonas_sp.AAC.1
MRRNRVASHPSPPRARSARGAPGPRGAGGPGELAQMFKRPLPGPWRRGAEIGGATGHGGVAGDVAATEPVEGGPGVEGLLLGGEEEGRGASPGAERKSALHGRSVARNRGAPRRGKRISTCVHRAGKS